MSDHYIVGLLFYIAVELFGIVVVLGVIHKELKRQRKP